MLERSGLATVLVVILAGALAADCVWARGRGGHGGGKRGGSGAHASAPSGGGARAAQAGGSASAGGARAGQAAASGGGWRMAHAGAAAGGAMRMAAVNGGGASLAAAHPAGAPAGGRAIAARAGGAFLAFGALSAFSRVDGRFYGAPPPRTGAAVGIAAFWEVPPPNYPAPVVVVPYRPSEYIEMGRDQPIVTPPRDFWYFCPDANGYFPHVDDCPGGWELVAPPGMDPTGWLGNPTSGQ